MEEQLWLTESAGTQEAGDPQGDRILGHHGVVAVLLTTTPRSLGEEETAAQLEPGSTLSHCLARRSSHTQGTRPVVQNGGRLEDSSTYRPLPTLILRAVLKAPISPFHG